jgi:carboxymethylenebutenolidase
MRLSRIFLLTLFMHAVAVCVNGQRVIGPETVVIRSGKLQLRALLWRPKGKGPFTAILFNHGRGGTPQTEGRLTGITELARVFIKHGYVFLAPFRRGEGLSADQGTFIGNSLERERAAEGEEAAKKLQVRLLESDQLDDALGGLAFLRTLPEVDRQRIAVVGHSFGGSLAQLVAERESSIRAAVNFAGDSESWEGSAELRKRLIAAVGRVAVPVLFVYTENDYSVAPGKALDTELARQSKVRRLIVFPPFG